MSDTIKKYKIQLKKLNKHIHILILKRYNLIREIAKIEKKEPGK